MYPRKEIAVLLYKGVNSLDVAGPLEAFATVRDDDGNALYRIVVWTLDEMIICSESGLKLYADALAPAAPNADLLILPGGAGVREPETLARLSAWLARNEAAFPRIASICTGAYALAASGLVDGRTLTTHWAHAADLRRRFPRVVINSDQLYSEDGKFLSSGGVTAGIDLALSVIERDHGARAAMQSARELVVFLRRTGSQAQFSEPLRLQSSAAGSLSDVCLWAANHLEADLSVDALAARANLSSRQFARRFRQAFGTSPAHHIATVRLDAARAALSQNGATVEQVAHASGYRSVDGFRRAFERYFRINPGEYQKRFAAKELST